MDNLTHTLFGLTLARTPLGRSGRGVTTALVLASNAPDVDIVMTARRNAAIVLVLMAANYSVRAVARYQAIGLAPRVFGPTLPQRCDGGAHDDRALVAAWPRGTPAPPVTGSRCLIEVAAMPSFFSPF